MGVRADIRVADTIILEIKAVPELLPAHEARLLTYLCMAGPPVGLPMNFHLLRLKDDLKRFVMSWSSVLRGPPAASALKLEAE